ncbi:MAG: alpha/beta fold hydrolase BchO [Myxococcota bacterium]
MSTFVEAGGIRWRLREAGAGPVLLALHGTGASGHSFEPVLQWLGEQHRVIVPDLPGHAETRVGSRADLSLRGMASSVATLMQAMDAQPAALLGHSAGAAVALELVRQGRVRPERVIGLAPALTPLKGMARAVFPRAAGLLAKRAPARAISARFRRAGSARGILLGTGALLDPAGIERYRELANQPAHVKSVLEMLAAWDLGPLYAALPSLDVPVLFLAGERDRAVPLDQIRDAAARLPRARLLAVRGAGHLLHEERPERVGPLLRDALTRPPDETPGSVTFA